MSKHSMIIKQLQPRNLEAEELACTRYKLHSLKKYSASCVLKHQQQQPLDFIYIYIYPMSSIKRQIKSHRLLFCAVIYPDNHLISIDFQRYQCNSFIWMSLLLDSAHSDELPDSSFKFPDYAIDFYATGKWMKGKVHRQQRVREAWV